MHSYTLLAQMFRYYENARKLDQQAGLNLLRSFKDDCAFYAQDGNDHLIVWDGEFENYKAIIVTNGCIVDEKNVTFDTGCGDVVLCECYDTKAEAFKAVLSIIQGDADLCS